MKIHAKTKRTQHVIAYCVPENIQKRLFLLKKILLVSSLYELLNENISTSLRRLVHTDAFYDTLCARFGCEGCDCFLCHK